ncbi:MAG: hypothetical protein QOH69_1435 [Actinomycetota bacterium]|jgi:hypothetical protein|nr:hypothetical protein [Actinomycetota bacterium]
MSKPRRLVLLSLVAATALLALTACAPASHLPGHGVHRTSTPGSTASPSPTAVAVAPPKVRIPLTCEQIAPAAQVTSVLGAPETLNTTDQLKGQAWQPFDLEPYAWVQDGARVCNYSTASPSDLTFFRAYVMPDASLALWTPFLAQQSAPSSFNIVPSPYGANSNLNCEYGYHTLDCDLEILIGSTWLSLYGFSDEYPASTVAAAAAKFAPLFSTAVAAVKTATIAEPLWTDPAASTVGLSSDVDSLDAALTTALGSPVSNQSYDYGPTIGESTDAAVIPVHLGYYQDGVGNYALNIQVLPQGDWAWSAIAAAAASEPGLATVTGLGDKAISFNVTGGPTPYESVIIVSKGHNVFSIEVDTGDVPSGPGTSTIAKKAATLIASKIG